jgi:hypothetical protein
MSGARAAARYGKKNIQHPNANILLWPWTSLLDVERRIKFPLTSIIKMIQVVLRRSGSQWIGTIKGSVSMRIPASKLGEISTRRVMFAVLLTHPRLKARIVAKVAARITVLQSILIIYLMLFCVKFCNSSWVRISKPLRKLRQCVEVGGIRLSPHRFAESCLLFFRTELLIA